MDLGQQYGKQLEVDRALLQYGFHGRAFLGILINMKNEVLSKNANNIESDTLFAVGPKLFPFLGCPMLDAQLHSLLRSTIKVYGVNY